MNQTDRRTANPPSQLAKALTVVLLLVGIVATVATADTVDLIDAHEEGRVQVTITGTGSLTRVTAQVRNLDTETVSVRIAPGTVFSTGDDRYQRMGVVGEVIVAVSPGQTKTVTVPVVCLDMKLDEPEEEMTFLGGLGRLDNEPIRRLVALPEFQDAGFRVQQFSIWKVLESLATHEEYMGLGLGGSVIDNLLSFGMSKELIAILYLYPEELIYSLEDEEVWMLCLLFDMAGAPVDGADELVMLLSTGRPTSHELAAIDRLLSFAGIPFEGAAETAASL